MDYHPNVEAVTWFTRRIWPVVRQRFPDWRLTLVGTNPRPAVRELQNEPNVEVTGTVPDVRPYYQDAVASVVPLHTGGGTRLKILEAMAAGVPVVSTTLGAEGLTVTPGKNIDIVDDEAGWLPALEALSTQERLWRERTSEGLALVRECYDWRKLGERLFQEYSSWLG
jgi:glycosyltransferase involved in cell wall biosynthesis